MSEKTCTDAVNADLSSAASDCSDFRCPHCDGEIEFDVTAIVPKSQTLTFEIKSDKGEMIGAELVAEAIHAMSKTLIAVAESLGSKVAVFVKDIRVTRGSVLIELTIGVVG
jgi:hypothetical protein